MPVFFSIPQLFNPRRIRRVSPFSKISTMIENLEIRDLKTVGPDLTAVDARSTVDARAYFHTEQANVRFGDSIQVDLAIKNNGSNSAPAGSTFDVDFLLLPNSSTPISQGIVVGTAQGLSAPLAGKTLFLDRFVLKLPDVAPFDGSGFTLEAVIDSKNRIAETNESNNSGQGALRDVFDLTILPKIQPTIDLTAVDATKSLGSRAYFHVEQSSPRFGDTVTVNLAVANQGIGSVPAGSTFGVNFVLLPNSSTPISQGVVVGTASALTIPAAGQSTLLDGFRLTLPDMAPWPGSGFTLEAVIDPTNNVIESNESNNSAQGTRRDMLDLTIGPKQLPGIDLTAVDASSTLNSRAYFHVEQNSLRFGDTVTVDLAIANQAVGSVPAGVTFDVQFVLLPNATTSISQGVVVGTAQGLAVPQAGKSVFLDGFRIKLPDVAPFDGSGFSLKAVIDPTNQISESNETNNFEQGAGRDVLDLTIGPKLQPAIDLTAVDARKTLGSAAYFHIEQNVVSFGDTVMLDLAVANQGVGAVPAGSTFDVVFMLLPNASTPVAQGAPVGVARYLTVPQAGQTFFLKSFPLTLPPVAPFSGIDFVLAAVIDSGNSIAESNEANNYGQGTARDLTGVTIATPVASWTNFGGSGKVPGVIHFDPLDDRGRELKAAVLDPGRYRAVVTFHGDGDFYLITRQIQISKAPDEVATYEDYSTPYELRLYGSATGTNGQVMTKSIEWTAANVERLHLLINTPDATGIIFDSVTIYKIPG